MSDRLTTCSCFLKTLGYLKTSRRSSAGVAKWQNEVSTRNDAAATSGGCFRWSALTHCRWTLHSSVFKRNRRCRGAEKSAFIAQHRFTLPVPPRAELALRFPQHSSVHLCRIGLTEGFAFISPAAHFRMLTYLQPHLLHCCLVSVVLHSDGKYIEWKWFSSREDRINRNTFR